MALVESSDLVQYNLNIESIYINQLYSVWETYSV